MVRKLKRNAAGRWIFAAGKDKGKFAKAGQISDFQALQRRNGRAGNVKRTKRLQNSISTSALNLGVSRDEAAHIIADYLNDRELAIELGSAIPDFPGTP